MSENERGSHFSGFASLLMQEMGREAIRPEHYWSSASGIAELERIIAQRAYDLVAHVVKESKYIQFHGTVITDDDYANATHQMVAEIPDLTKWPEH